MASQLAKRIIGESGQSDSPSSNAARDWFNSLGDDVKEFLVSNGEGESDAFEISALAYLVPTTDRPEGVRAATWEELQNPNLEGDWDHVHFEGREITCYGVYKHLEKGGVMHLKDFQTKEEAVQFTQGLAALTGFPVGDFTPNGAEAFHQE